MAKVSGRKNPRGKSSAAQSGSTRGRNQQKSGSRTPSARKRSSAKSSVRRGEATAREMKGQAQPGRETLEMPGRRGKRRQSSRYRKAA